MARLAREFNLTMGTVRKYLEMPEQELESLKFKYRTRRGRKGEAFVNIIFKMMKDGHSDKVIFSYLRKYGIKDLAGSIMNYITSISMSNFPQRKRLDGRDLIQERYPDDVIVLHRSDILKYVLTVNPKTEKSEDVGKYITQIMKKYPIVEWTRAVFSKFHEILMGDVPERIDSFIEEFKSTKISGFCEGLKQDIISVKNAIRYVTSSGFVEGDNNKFKLIKRTLYGRAKLQTLAAKCFIAFAAGKRKDFNLAHIVSTAKLAL